DRFELGVELRILRARYARAKPPDVLDDEIEHALFLSLPSREHHRVDAGRDRAAEDVVERDVGTAFGVERLVVAGVGQHFDGGPGYDRPGLGAVELDRPKRRAPDPR